MNMINMGNDIITCFNQQECTYKECPMYSEKLDLCKIELLKSEPNPVDNPRTEKKTPVGEQSKRKPELGDKTLIRDLKPNDKSSKDHKINIEGTVVYEPKVNSTNTGKEVCNLVLKDESGQISLAFWDSEIEKVMDFTVGDKVRVENIWRIDEPYEGTAKASPGKWAKIISL